MAGILDFLNLGAATPTPINPYGENNSQYSTPIPSPVPRPGVLGNIDPSALIAAGGTILSNSRSAGIPLSTGQIIGQGILAAQQAQNNALQQQMEQVRLGLEVRRADLQEQVRRRELALETNRQKFFDEFGSNLSGSERLLFQIAPDEVIKSKLNPRKNDNIMFVPGTGIAIDRSTGEVVGDYSQEVRDVKLAGKPQININLGEDKGAEKAYQISATKMGEAYDAASVAERTNSLYTVLEPLIDAANTGSFAEYRLRAHQTLASLGLPNDAEPGEVFEAVSGQLELIAAQQLKGQGQITEFERRIVQQNIPKLSKSGAGIRAIIKVNRALNQIDIEYNDAVLSYAEENGKSVLSLPELNSLRKQFRDRAEQILQEFQAEAEQITGGVDTAQPTAAPQQQPSNGGGYNIDLDTLLQEPE